MRLALIATLAALASSVDIKLLEKSTLLTSSKVRTLAQSSDGPTNGEMSADEKDTLIQVLCPGPIQTSYSIAQGKSSTCNAGSQPAKASLVQETTTAGDAQMA